MHATGRALEEYLELAMTFDRGTARWRVEGKAGDVAIGETRKAILHIVGDKKFSIRQIDEELKLKGNDFEFETVRKTIGRMTDDGQLLREGVHYSRGVFGDGVASETVPSVSTVSVVAFVPPVPPPTDRTPGTPGTEGLIGHAEKKTTDLSCPAASSP